MGTIEPYTIAAGKRYRVRYRKPDHSQTDKRGFKTKREAELYLATVEISKATGDWTDASASRVTVGELSVSWLAVKRASLKPSSFESIQRAWSVWVGPRWGSTPVGSILPSDVEKWVAELSTGTAINNRTAGRLTPGEHARRRSPSVVIRAVGVLAGVLDQAMKDRRITRNPARGLEGLPRKRKRGERHRYLTHDQVIRLADACESDLHAAVVLTLAYTGLRWGEMLALRVRDFDALRGRIEVNRSAVEVARRMEVGTPKSGEQRSVAVPKFLVERMARLCEGKTREDLIFGDGIDGYLRRPNTSDGTRSWWLTALSEAGLDRLVLHDLRHTAASLMISSGANVKAVQRQLGHSSAAMTLDRYSDLFDDDLDAVGARLNDAALTAGVAKTSA